MSCATNQQPFSAAMLFALAQNTSWRELAGEHLPFRCHWCGSACSDREHHDDIPIIQFMRLKDRPEFSHCPGDPFICKGCALFRRTRVSIPLLEGGFVDAFKKSEGQKHAVHYSWWISEEGAWAITPSGYSKLVDLLLKPPLRFALALVDGNTKNPLQLMRVNNNLHGVKSTTPLCFTVNAVSYSYTPYELEQAILHGPNGTEPGTHHLFKLLEKQLLAKKPHASEKPAEEKRGRGRAKGETPEYYQNVAAIKKTIAFASGAVA